MLRTCRNIFFLLWSHTWVRTHLLQGLNSRVQFQEAYERKLVGKYAPTRPQEDESIQKNQCQNTRTFSIS